MSYLYINNYRSTLAAELTSGQTVMTLNDASPISDASEDNRYKLTLVEVDAGGREIGWEIVEAIGVTGNNVTIVRALEGTTSPASWPITTVVDARATAGHLANFVVAAPGPAEAFVHDIGPLDFATTDASVSYALPAGRRLFIDTIDIVPLADGGTAGSWSTEAGTPSLPNNGQKVSYNNDDTLLAVVHSSAPYYAVYNTSTWAAETMTYTAPTAVRDCHFSPDGSLLALAVANGNLVVLNTADWTVAHTEATGSSQVYACRFSHDGTKLAWGALDFSTTNFFGVLTVSGWTADATFSQSQNVYSLAWSPDDSHVAIGTANTPYVSIRDVATWTEQQALTGLGSDGLGLDYSLTGPYLAVAIDGNASLAIVNTSDWSITNPTLLNGSGFGGKGVAFNPVDGRLALAYDTSPNVAAIYSPGSWTAESAGQVDFTNLGCTWSNSGDTVAFVHEDGPEYLSVYSYSVASVQPAPFINVGVDATDDRSIVNEGVLTPFTQYSRISLSPSYATGVSSVHVEVAEGQVTGASARVVIKGYTIAE